MRLLDRYLLRELLTPLSFCLGGFLVSWIAFDLFAEIDRFSDKHLLPLDIVVYYMVRSPEFLVFVMPISLLLALLYTLTSLARHHEITAIRAAGVGLWRITLPFLAVGFIASLVSLAVNELWVPDSEDRAEEVLQSRLPRMEGAAPREEVRNLGFTNNRERRDWLIGIYNPVTGEMINPQVMWLRPDGIRLWVKAERGKPAPQGGWTFSGVRQFVESTTNALMQPLAPLEQAHFQFSETPEEIASEIRVSENMSLRKMRRIDLPVVEIANYLKFHPTPRPKDAAWLYTKLHGRLAAPWTCLVVVLVAIPFGAASGRRNLFVGVAVSIVICFAYFVLQQVGLGLGTGAYVPPWIGAWGPNVLFALGGLWLTHRVR